MLVAVGHHPTPGTGCGDCVLLTVQCFIPAQSPDMFAVSIGAGTVSQSPVEQNLSFLSSCPL